MEGQNTFGLPVAPAGQQNGGFGSGDASVFGAQEVAAAPITTTKKSKKGLVVALVGLLLAGGGVGAYFLLNKPAEPVTVSFANAKTFPDFSEGETDYTIYTEADTLTPTCRRGNEVIDCGISTFAVVSGEMRKQITIGDKTYDFYVTKVEDATSPVKITGVTGVPKTWVPKATLYVETMKTFRDDFVEYSFDGGKTWQQRASREVTENGVYRVMLRDYFGFTSKVETVKVALVDAVAPELAIETSEEKDGKWKLMATYSDGLSGVAKFVWSNKSTDKEIEVAAGTYSATVMDVAGNKTTRQVTVGTKEQSGASQGGSSQGGSSQGGSELPNTSGGGSSQGGRGSSQGGSVQPTPQPATQKTFTAKFGGDVRTCSTYGAHCEVKAPEIVREGWEILGWSESAEAVSAQYAAGATIVLEGDVTFYPITRRKLAVEFKVQNQSAVRALSDTVRACYVYNAAESCEVVVPELVARDGYVALGWATDRAAQAAEVQGGEILALGATKTYYSVTRSAEALAVSFVVRDPDALSGVPERVECYLWNSETTCEVVAPKPTVREGFEFLGWTLDASLAATEAGASEKITVSRPETYYSVSRNSTVVTATFGYDVSGSSQAYSIVRECYRYNGAKSCQVVVPSTADLIDPTIVGWKAVGATGDKVYYGGEKISLAASARFVAYRGDVPEPEEPGEPEPTEPEQPVAKTWTATFTVLDSTTAAAGAESVSCTTQGGASACEIVLPSLVGNNGWTASGWRRTKDGKVYQPLTTLEIAADEAFTAVVKKDQVTLSAEFVVQDGSAVTNLASETRTCQADPGQTCVITAPVLTANAGWTAIGWEENPASVTSAHPGGATIVLTKSKATYYSVTRRTAPLMVTYTISEGQESFVSLSGGTEACVLYNGATACQVHTPVIVSTNPGYEAYGFIDVTDPAQMWFKPMDADVEIARDSVFEAMAVVVTPPEPETPEDPEEPEPEEPEAPTKTFTAHFILQNPAAASADTSDVSCTTVPGGSSCAVTLPTLAGLNGWRALGWSTNRNAMTVSGNSFGTYTISGDTTFYAITSKELRATFTIEDAAAVSKSGGTYACQLYNTASSCQITAPTLTAKAGYTASGWATRDGAVVLTSGEKKYISQNLDFYAVTAKQKTTLSATFTVLNSKHVAESSTTLSCEATDGSCAVTAPMLTAKAGYAVLGWAEMSGAHSGKYAVGDAITLTSAQTTFYSVTKTAVPLAATFTLSDQSAATVGADGVSSCDLYNAETTCYVTLPSLTAKAGWTVSGWQKAGASTLYQGGEQVGISGNTTFTAVVTKNATEKTLTATFTVQNALAAYAASASVSCKTTDDSCYVTVPALTAYAGYTAVGWGVSAGATSAAVMAGGSVRISGGETFYSVTSKTLRVNFVNNNTAAGYIVGSATSASCTAWNAANACEITFPSLAANAGYSVVGWGATAGATMASYTPGETVSVSVVGVSSSLDVYAIFEKAAVPTEGRVVTVTFRKGSAERLSYETASCTIKPGEDYCTLGVYGPRPYGPGKYWENYQPEGRWETARIPKMQVTDDTWVSLMENGSGPSSYLASFTINPTKHYVMPNGMEVEFEDSVSDEVAAYHLRAINAVYQNLPVLFITRGKVTYVDEESMDSLVGQTGVHGVAFSSYIGGVSTSDGNEFTNVFIGLRYHDKMQEKTNMTSGNSFDSDVVAHELTHAFDNIYGIYHGHDVGGEDEMKEIFWQYYGNTANAPVTTYAWSLMSETFPEEVRLYFNRFNPDPLYSPEGIATRLPSKFEALVEKYLCIGVNGFDRSKTTCNLSSYVPE